MLLIDGLECGVYDRDVLLQLRDSGMAAITITAAFWEDALETMDAIATWDDLARGNADLIVIARTANDIVRAHQSGRTAIVIGTQNSSPINDRLGFVKLFSDMGLRVMQLTYNNQNAIGGSCYDPSDGGLSRFGREVVSEMNTVGMLIDLSHVGNQTSIDVIKHSAAPVAITHANPYSVYEHPRNKPDDLLRALATSGGVLGLATYNNISGDFAASAGKWCEMVCRAIDIMGIDHVAIGTDLAQKSTNQRREWMRKGRWTRSEQSGATLPGRTVPPNEWLTSTVGFAGIAEHLRATGRFREDEIQAVMGKNWLRLYQQTWPTETALEG